MLLAFHRWHYGATAWLFYGELESGGKFLNPSNYDVLSDGGNLGPVRRSTTTFDMVKDFVILQLVISIMLASMSKRL